MWEDAAGGGLGGRAVGLEANGSNIDLGIGPVSAASAEADGSAKT